jgi:formamidopyrimidine-DNA glycosylase
MRQHAIKLRRLAKVTMPELPEVETVVRTLRPHVRGERIVRVDLRRTDIVQPTGSDLRTLLVGRIVQSLDRRGKRIVFTLDDGNTFYIHLGMSGKLTAETSDAPVRKHTHLIMDTTEGQLRFCDPRRFGGIWWLGANSADEGMGPEPLSMRSEQLLRNLHRTKRAIKVALLDQTLVAGIGNIYADEALFLAKIHPLKPANRLSEAEVTRLTSAIKEILRAAIKYKGSSLRDYTDAKGRRGRFQHQHRVYQQEGKACTGCGKPIQRIVLGGRSTHFCGRCQKRGKAANKSRSESRSLIKARP